MSNTLKFFTKLVISGILLFLISKKINFNELIIQAKSTSVFILVITFSLTVSKKVIESFRWKLVLESKKYKEKLIRLFSLYMIGGFFNIFLPSTLGGDTLRILYVKRKELSLKTATSTVLFERMIGLYSIFIMAIIAISIGWNSIMVEMRLPVLVISCICTLLMTSVFILYDKILSFTKQLSSKISLNIFLKFYSYLKLFNFKEYGAKIALICFFLSIFIQLIVICITALIGYSMDLDEIGLLNYFVIMPPIWVITMLPISIGGFGVREGLFILLLAPLGIGIEQSTLLSLLSFLPFVIVGLLGSLFYLFGSNLYKETVNVNGTNANKKT